MYIEELKGGGVDCGKEEEQLSGSGAFPVGFVAEDARRALVGAGARALFYPTLLYNVLRNKVQAEFRWWDRVDEFVLLGAVPFPSDVLRLKELGVGGVVTLNEPYETLVPTSLYHAHGIDHLVIPTRDYLFAPSLTDICQAVDFIHKNCTYGRTTYVHCKAGRGRSTTIVICYLVQHKQMMPADAYDYLKSIRPRVRLASSQWQAVQEYFHLYVKRTGFCGYMANLVMKPPVVHLSAEDLVAFDEDSIVVVTESDLDGYDPCLESGSVGSEIWADLSVVYRFRVAGQAALARISCLWLRYHANQNISREMLLVKQPDRLGGLTVDIQVY